MKKDKCFAENCKEFGKILGYCTAHYQQFKTYGHIPPRTMRDKNEIINCGLFCKMVLYDRKNTPIAEAIFDSDDLEKVMQHNKWGVQGGGYVATTVKINKKYKTLRLHNVILPPKPNTEVDHINGDKLDNRKSNLRLCSHKENCWNKTVKYPSKSGIKGVYQNKYGNWQSWVTVAGKKIYLGTFYTKEEAALAYKNTMMAYYGEFAPTEILK